MDAQLKEKWVEALRSGAYRQTRAALRDDDGFCCLGVLCDLMGAKWTGGDCRIKNELQTSYLAPEAETAAGLAFEVQNELWRMNDNDGKSFAEIADYIEANL